MQPGRAWSPADEAPKPGRDGCQKVLLGKGQGSTGAELMFRWGQMRAVRKERGCPAEPAVQLSLTLEQALGELCVQNGLKRWQAASSHDLQLLMCRAQLFQVNLEPHF